jgi:uncharacterized protein YigE (DUF2233 family)
LLFILAPIARGQNSWRAIQPGLERLDGTFDDYGETVRFVSVRLDPKKQAIRVIDTFHELRAKNALSTFSLREVSDKTHAALVVNAGATTSFSLPAPAGLLPIGGKTIHRASFSNDGTAEILCVEREHVSLIALRPGSPANCVDAVQKGPLLTPHFKSARSRNQRTIVALNRDGLVLIFVTLDGTSLSGVSEYLYSPKSALNIQSALNLDGSVSSGMILVSDKRPETIGNVDSLIASAIVISSR